MNDEKRDYKLLEHLKKDVGSLLDMEWIFSENPIERLDTITTIDGPAYRTWKSPDDPRDLRYANDLLRRYSSPAVETPIEVAKETKINPKEFEFTWYSRGRDYGKISENQARDDMTDYFYHDFDPLIFKKVYKHYYLAGPDANTSPTKRKFYNALSWYRDFYDGRHGQTTEVEVEEIDLNEWDDLIIAMVVSGDFSLKEAMYAVANACDRCRHALLWKYRELHPRTDGYSHKSPEYRDSLARCNFCRCD